MHIRDASPWLAGPLVAALASFALGCSPQHETDDFESAEADLSTSQFDEACSEPVRSEDGKYFLLDLCPKGSTPGRIVRVETATGTQTEVTTYATGDRVERLTAKGPAFWFGIRRAVDGLGRATQGIDVVVRDWALERGRTFSAAAPTGVDGAPGALRMLMLTADGEHVAFSAADGELSKLLFVAPVTGSAEPVALDVGVPSSEVRWSSAGSSLVGHVPDDTGETLILVDVGGEDLAKIAAKRHVDWRSFAFGMGGTREQAPFDGTRIVGFKVAPDRQSIGTVDPRTGEEKVLDSAPLLGIVTDLGPDVLYSRVTEASGGGFVRELVKRPRAGGDATVLVSSTAASRDELRYGFEPIAVSESGAFGVFATHTGGTQERFLVKLDGSAPATTLGSAVRVVEQLGELVLVVDGGADPAVFRILDLATGTFTTLGPSGGPHAFAHLVGDGSIVQLEQCTTPQGRPGRSVRHTTSAGTEVSECTWMPWASVPLAVAGSDTLVFYNARGPFPDLRYDVGIVKP